MPVDSQAKTSTRRALVYVYLGYGFRYVYLLVLIPFYARVLGASEYGRLLAAMSLFQMVWLLVEYGFPIVGARDTAAATDRGAVSAIYGRHVVGRFALALPGLLVGIGGTLLSPLLREAPWFGLWPGIALTILLVGLNYLSDALRDALDPRRVNLN